jgi:hypothetical protein
LVISRRDAEELSAFDLGGFIDADAQGNACTIQFVLEQPGIGRFQGVFRHASP